MLSTKRDIGAERKLPLLKWDQPIILSSKVAKVDDIKQALPCIALSAASGFAILSGLVTVRQAMDDGEFQHFLREFLFDEVCPILNHKLNVAKKTACVDVAIRSLAVIPNELTWNLIATQLSNKIQQRLIPIVRKHYTMVSSSNFERMAFSFAAFIRLMKPYGSYPAVTGRIHEHQHIIEDEQILTFRRAWKTPSLSEMLKVLLADKSVWGVDLSQYGLFSGLILKYLSAMDSKDIMLDL